MWVLYLLVLFYYVVINTRIGQEKACTGLVLQLIEGSKSRRPPSVHAKSLANGTYMPVRPNWLESTKQAIASLRMPQTECNKVIEESSRTPDVLDARGEKNEHIHIGDAEPQRFFLAKKMEDSVEQMSRKGGLFALMHANVRPGRMLL